MADALTTRSDRDLAALVSEKVLGQLTPAWRPDWTAEMGKASPTAESWSVRDYFATGPLTNNDAPGWLGVCVYDHGDEPEWLPKPYASDLSAFVADVVPAMRAQGFPWFMLRYDPMRPDGAPTWTATFGQHAYQTRGDDANPARAGCLAALRALESTT